MRGTNMKIELKIFESADLSPIDFCLWRTNRDVYERKVYTEDELLARILDAAARIKTREDQLRRTAGDLRTRVAKCIAVDGGILEHLL